MLLPLLFSLITISHPGPGDPLPTVAGSAVNKTILLQMVNKVRQNGCQCGDTYYPATAPLVWNDKLEQAAQKHSRDMLSKKFFSHTAPDGTDGGTRIRQAGYNWRAFGENIAFNYPSEQAVIDGWIKSTGHCKNIMNKDFKEMAVARAGNYWTQTFGAR